jgi:plastocyanin
MKKATRGAAALTMVAVLILAGCGKKSSTASSTTTTPASSGVKTVRAGLNDPKDANIAVLQFLPAATTVAVGEKLDWKFSGPEPHTVTFFPPGENPPTPDKADQLFSPTPPTGPYDGSTKVNSGLLPQGAPAPNFELSFSKAGAYTYHCVIHPQMVGTVNVVAAGGKTDSAADITQRGDTELGGWLAEGRAAKAQLESAAPKQTKAADGTTTWTVETGTSTAHTDVLAFTKLPDIKAGDKVTFVNNSGAPHTASFGGTKVPGNPADPAAAAPAPGKSPQALNDSDFFNTGILPPNAPPGAGPPEIARSFTFSVPKAGSYSYVCIFHAPSGMGGVIKAT